MRQACQQQHPLLGFPLALPATSTASMAMVCCPLPSALACDSVTAYLPVTGSAIIIPLSICVPSTKSRIRALGSTVPVNVGVGLLVVCWPLSP